MINTPDRVMDVKATEVTVLNPGVEITPSPVFDGARQLQPCAVTNTIANGVDTATISLKGIDPIGQGNMVVPNGEAVLAWGVNEAGTLGIAVTTKGVRSYTITGANPTTDAVWAADVALQEFDTAVAWGGYGSENRWDIAIGTPASANAVVVTVNDNHRGTSHVANLSKTGIGPLDLYAGWPPATLRALIPFCFGCAFAGYSPKTLTIDDASIAAGDYSTNHAAVGTFSAEEYTTGATFTYSLVAGTGDTDNANYEIGTGNDAGKLMAAAVLAEGTDSVRVRVTNADGRYAERQFTVTVTA